MPDPITPTYHVIIQRVSDGEMRQCPQTLPWHPPDKFGSGDWFWWSEGNMSCDCNRFLEFERAGGCEPDWDEGECGESRYRVIRFLFPDGTWLSGPDEEL